MAPQPQQTNERNNVVEGDPCRDDYSVLLDREEEGDNEQDLESAFSTATVSFLQLFVKSRGPPQITFLLLIFALGFGSTVGVVPALMSDRYARLHYGFTGDVKCMDWPTSPPPEACLQGSAEAQNTVAKQEFISNFLTFTTSSWVGSLSDEYGRKRFLCLGVFLAALSPITLLLMQLNKDMDPIWYYGMGTVTGFVNWVAIALSAFSDVMPPQWRAPSFGLLLAGFSLGFSFAPLTAVLLGDFQVTVLSVIVVVMCVLYAVVALPETLPPRVATEAREKRLQREDQLENQYQRVMWNLYRPLWELSILNRNRLFRLLSALAFFSGIVSAGDQSLLLYYVEEQFSFTNKDVAVMFLIFGILGIFFQSVLLKVFNDAFGARKVIMICFFMGTVHNMMYGFAKTKATIFVAVSLAPFVMMSFPNISALKSNNVEESEQGRIQGALYSIQSLASAVGPMFLRFVYHLSKNENNFLGPGSMFVAAGALYLVAVFCAYLLPEDRARASEHVILQQQDEH